MIPDDAAVHFLGELRTARIAAGADSENSAALLTSFERLGYHLIRPETPSGLGDYRAKLVALANSSGVPDALATDVCEGSATDLFDSVLAGRNEEMHIGISARRLVDHAIRFAVMLEAGLMADLKLVKHFMVAGPICAAPWQTVALVRQTMLLHQFSFLPYRPAGEAKWKLISDYAVAAYLGATSSRSKALSRTLEDVLPTQALKTLEAPTIGPKDKVAELAQIPQMLPWLVVEGPDKELRGILTPFDLL